MKHKLMRSGTSTHRCLLCLKIFDGLTPEQARQIDEACTPPKVVRSAGWISIDLSDSEIDLVLGVMEYPRARSVLKPVMDHRDSAQQKGDDLATKIEQEWSRDDD